MIISAPLIINWNLSVISGLSSLALANGLKLIGCSVKKIGLTTFGLATFLYNWSTKLPYPKSSNGVSQSISIFSS